VVKAIAKEETASSAQQ